MLLERCKKKSVWKAYKKRDQPHELAQTGSPVNAGKKGERSVHARGKGRKTGHGGIPEVRVWAAQHAGLYEVKNFPTHCKKKETRKK